MNKYRILCCTTIPNFMHTWILERIVGKTVDVCVTNGEHGQCFDMWELSFEHQTDEIEFKRQFGAAIFTPSEIEQSNENTPRPINSSLWKSKFEVYQTMREQNNERSFR